MLTITLLASLVTTAGPSSFKLDATQPPKVTYSVVHKLHRIQGTSQSMEGAARIQEDGSVQVMVRAPIDSFDSGNSNRDAHMKEAVESAKFPSVSVKAAMKIKVPQSFPSSITAPAVVEVTLHGVSQRLTTAVTLDFRSAQTVHAEGRFPVSWEAFHIERPQLMFVPIEDRGEVWFELAWQKVP